VDRLDELLDENDNMEVEEDQLAEEEDDDVAWVAAAIVEHCVALVDDNMDLEVPYKQYLDHARELEALLQQPYVHNPVVWLGLCEKVVFFVELLDIDGHAAVAAAASGSNDWDNSLSICLMYR